jgi:hypothetical protein
MLWKNKAGYGDRDVRSCNFKWERDREVLTENMAFEQRITGGNSKLRE